MTMLPSKTTLPAHTEFPEVIDTGMLSPVIADCSISVFPDNTIPSTGMTIPALTVISSPIL